MKIVAAFIVLLAFAAGLGTASAGRKSEIPDDKLQIACAMKAGKTWQLKPNETVKTDWRRLNRDQWEITLGHEQKKAVCVIKESGEIDSFTED